MVAMKMTQLPYTPSPKRGQEVSNYYIQLLSWGGEWGTEKNLFFPIPERRDVYNAVCFSVGGYIWWVTILSKIYGDSLNVKNKG